MIEYIDNITPELKEQALALALKVFMEFEAPDYPEEGVEDFKKALKNPDYVGQLKFIVAMLDGKMVGMTATRSAGSHIALLFVDREFQRQGIGREMILRDMAKCPIEKITVFSSPFAVKIYERIGFVATDTEQITNGVRYTPMEYILERR